MSAHETLHALVRTNMPVLSPDTTIRRAVATLVKEHASAAVVIDDSGALQGILTQKDCFRPSLSASYYQEWKGTVADFMTSDVISLSASVDVMAAAEEFLNHSHRVFPVFDGSEFIGMLRRSDVLRRLVELG